MLIIDYEDAASIAGSDGQHHACTISGIVAPDNPASAGLGHSPTALAEQSWQELTLRVDAALDFEAGRLTFADGSQRAVKLSLSGSDDDAHVYALKLKRA